MKRMCSITAILIATVFLGGCGYFAPKERVASLEQKIVTLEERVKALENKSISMVEIEERLVASEIFMATMAEKVCEMCDGKTTVIKPVVIPKPRPLKLVVRDFAGFKDDCRDSTKGCGSVQKNIEVGSADGGFAGYSQTKRAVDEYHELSKPTMEVK